MESQLAVCEGIRQLLDDSPHKGPVIRIYFIFVDDNLVASTLVVRQRP